MTKQSLKFIDGIIESEFKIKQWWSDESILHNRYWKNLFLIYRTKEELKEYLIHCCENKIRI